MNLLLAEEHELLPDGRLHLSDRRHEHLRSVLRIAVGETVEVGLLHGRIGQAVVEAHDRETTTLACEWTSEGPALGSDLLVLAVPRPVVLVRCLEAATAMGFGRIVLLRTRLVDKSHLMAKAIQPEALEQHLRRGLEQGARTRPPRLHIAERFKPFVEEQLEALAPIGPRFVGHPAPEPTGLSDALAGSTGFTLAVGPERGFTDHEIEQFSSHGFETLSAGPSPLRVETALAYLTGILQHRRAASGG